MRSFSRTVEIAAPPDRVWQVMSDIVQWPEWTPSVISVKRLDDRPFGVGSRALIRQPKIAPALWRVSEMEPGRGFTWVNRSPGLRLVARHAVESATGGSRATLSLEFRGLFAGLFGLIMKGMTERYLEMEAQGLKARSESPAYRHTSRGR